jgi:hypothetical protein
MHALGPVTTCRTMKQALESRCTGAGVPRPVFAVRTVNNVCQPVRSAHSPRKATPCQTWNTNAVDTPMQPQGIALPQPQAEVNSTKCADPFLAALLASDEKMAEDVFKRDVHLREEFGEVEQQLQAKADATSHQFQQLLSCIQVCKLLTVREEQKRAKKRYVRGIGAVAALAAGGTCSLLLDNCALISCNGCWLC